MLLTEELLGSKGLKAGCLTVGDCISIAEEMGTTPGEIAIEEAALASGKSKKDVEEAVLKAFEHNLAAVDKGLTDGHSFILGTVAKDLLKRGSSPVLMGEPLLDKALLYTLAAQVGNHEIGLQPCAGTGDSCPYTGVFKAMGECGINKDKLAQSTAIMLKVGTIFRAGKSTTGCNMEGFGAGAAACAAAFVEMWSGDPQTMNRAICLAISPTIAVPCTPRVLVPGLCATHIGGAVLVGYYSAKLALLTEIPVNVDVDVMMALAAAVHPVSAKHIVPINIKYLEPFFRRKEEVDAFIEPEILREERRREAQVLADTKREVRALASKANLILKPFGEACVGGSSQAVGSPTNCGRIAHALAKGKIRKVKIELYPELFARRGINVQGILMGAVYGRGTDDAASYREVLGWIKRDGVEVEIKQVEESQCQRVTLFTDAGTVMVDSRNRGGGRLALVGAIPSLEAARDAARKLGIVVTD
ncbi:MAG TPA: serine dehydratase [Firmicutes bacterium]|nr:serine dehydratase [Bacillota bacterium]